MSSVTVYPCTLSGKLSVPGDKSISQRVALLASLASGTSEISGYLDSEDAQNTLLGRACWQAFWRVLE